MADSADTTNPILRKCSVEECGEPVRAKGLCKIHYQRQRIWGRTHLVRQAVPMGSTAAWLREHVSYEGKDCLFWPYARNRNGYGTATIDRYYTLAHRHMCILAHGEPPFPKAEAAHFCGGGADGCVHPKHVRWATRSVNQQDKTLHGTHYTHNQRLTEAQVLEIFSDDRAPKVIAKAYGCSAFHVTGIKRGHSWSHLTGQEPIERSRHVLASDVVKAVFVDPRPSRIVAAEYGLRPYTVWLIRARRIHAAVTEGLTTSWIANAQKLTEEQVLSIYSSTAPAVTLAAMHSCSAALVYHIRNGRAWSSVTGHKRRNAS